MADPFTIIEDIKTRIKEIVEGEIIPASGEAKTGSIQDAPNLPTVEILTDAATSPDSESDTGSELVVITRTFNLFLLVQPWVEGDELEAEAAVSPYIPKFWYSFKGRQALEYPRNENALPFIYYSRITGDTGVINIRIAGIDYAGCQFTLSVQYVMRVDFA